MADFDNSRPRGVKSSNRSASFAHARMFLVGSMIFGKNGRIDSQACLHFLCSLIMRIRLFHSADANPL
jgi:hypothetical protein